MLAKVCLLPEDAVVALTRTHGKADVDALLGQMSSLVLSIPANAPMLVLLTFEQQFRTVMAPLSTGLTEDDSNVQQAEVPGSLMEDADSDDEVRLQFSIHHTLF
jgi:hypothetical protein